MAILNGTDLLLYFSTDSGTTWTALAHATSHSISYNMATRETSDKSSGAAKTIAPSRTSFSGSADGLVTYVASCDYHTLLGYIKNRTELMIASAQDDGTGDPDSATVPTGTAAYYTGMVYLTSVDITGGDEENTTYSVSFEGNGDLGGVDGTQV
jgi:TP901-1 family phage major tail protein